MATTGSVDVNMTPIGNSINSSTGLASAVIGGVKDQGDLIGLAIGLFIAVGLLVVLIMYVLGVPAKLIAKVKGLRGA